MLRDRRIASRDCVLCSTALSGAECCAPLAAPGSASSWLRLSCMASCMSGATSWRPVPLGDLGPLLPGAVLVGSDSLASLAFFSESICAAASTADSHSCCRVLCSKEDRHASAANTYTHTYTHGHGAPSDATLHTHHIASKTHRVSGFGIQGLALRVQRPAAGHLAAEVGADPDVAEELRDLGDQGRQREQALGA